MRIKTDGTCLCGCGGKTRRAPCTNKAAGWIKGEWTRYIHGHNHRRIDPYRIDKTTGCWVWGGRLTRKGYGQTGITINGVRKCVRAHRHMYEKMVGGIPPGMQLDHLCKNRACVNPQHLDVVTPNENRRRRIDSNMNMAKAAFARRMISDGYSNSEIATLLGVTEPVISNIKNRRAWREDVL